MKTVAQPAPPEGVVEGRLPAAAPSEKPKLRMDFRHNFVFLAHPAQWDVVNTGDGPRLVPRLREFSFEPGVAGVEQVKGSWDGRPDRALTELARKGWSVIPRRRPVVAHGETFLDYALCYEGHKGLVHLPVWKRPYIRGGEVVIDFDDDGWHTFLVNLLDEGVVAGPDRQALRAHELSMRSSLARHRTSAERSAFAIEVAELYERKLDAFKVYQGGKSRRPAGPAVEPVKPSDVFDETAVRAMLDKAAAEAAARTAEAVDRAVAEADARAAKREEKLRKELDAAKKAGPKPEPKAGESSTSNQGS